MTLEVALPWDRTLTIGNEPSPEFAGGISSLRNSWLRSSPLSFDTVSLPEVGVSVYENKVIVSLKTISDASSSKWLNQTVSKMVQLLWLPEDWSSDSPKRISSRSIERILAVFLTILDPDSPPPVVVPTTQGGVQVEWHQNDVDLEIEATSSGKLEFFFSGPKGDKEGLVGDDPAILKQYAHYIKSRHTP